jgi:hypothetical protein
MQRLFTFPSGLIVVWKAIDCRGQLLFILLSVPLGLNKHCLRRNSSGPFVQCLASEQVVSASTEFRDYSDLVPV